MRLGIMQPYFFPYLGYFQLMSSVDKFVVYDNIKYTKQSWINRNRVMIGGDEVLLTVSLAKGSDSLDIVEREISSEFRSTRQKMLRQIEQGYQRRAGFADAFPVVRECLMFEEPNLFRFLYHSIDRLRRYLRISTQMLISSEVHADHSLRGSNRVLSICKALGADEYINPEGGQELYDRKNFLDSGIALKFLEHIPVEYPQSVNAFVPRLSIIDVILNNSRDSVSQLLSSYRLF